jgi:hypothetical protein
MSDFKLHAHTTERLLTLKQAAEALGLPYFKVQRAAKAGLFNTYTFYNKRPLVRLSEVIRVIESSKRGGAQ